MSTRFRTVVIGLCSWAFLATSTAAQPPEYGPVAYAPPSPSPLSADWVQGPIAQIYVRGYKDSDGDGYGDLPGLIEQLDYLKALGFRGIWLMPIFASSDHNHGYAVEDYRRIEPEFGTEADLKRLLDAAHQRDIGVMLDYVPNQASSEHPLFQAAIDKTSPYRDFFVWQPRKPEGWRGFNGEPWHRLKGAWYYGLFDRAMPDWNWHNPAVVEFHLDNLRHWLNLGVDGFRQDALGALVENGPSDWTDQPESRAMGQRMRQLMQQYPGAKYQICEAPSDPAGYAAADACGSAFAFGLQGAIIRSASLGFIDNQLPAYLEHQPVERMGTFLSNHDSFAGQRLYNQVQGDLASYRLAVATQYLLPGTPFTLYGEEIGMSMARAAGADNEQIRAPMPWNGSDTVTDAQGEISHTFGGFTRLPPGQESRMFRALPDNWREFNVAAQREKPDSLWHFYRNLIALRAQSPALKSGGYRAVEAWDMEAKPTNAARKPSGTVFVFLREHAAERVLVAINYANREQRIELNAKLATLERIGGSADAVQRRDAKKRTSLTLPAQGFVVFRVKS